MEKSALYLEWNLRSIWAECELSSSSELGWKIEGRDIFKFYFVWFIFLYVCCFKQEHTGVADRHLRFASVNPDVNLILNRRNYYFRRVQNVALVVSLKGTHTFIIFFIFFGSKTFLLQSWKNRNFFGYFFYFFLIFFMEIQGICRETCIRGINHYAHPRDTRRAIWRNRCNIGTICAILAHLR